MKNFLKTVKGKVITGAVAAGVAAAVVAVVIVINGQDAFRTIAVQETNGAVVVQNEEKGSKEAYEGMHLYSGDDVTVQPAADMTMLLDMDKYVYAEENTHFWLEANDDENQTRTRIYLDQGSMLNYLKTDLKEGESYEVSMPNSIMSVRGTVFRVRVYKDEKGLTWADLEVYQGEVGVDLQKTNGEANGVSETFAAGEAALIRADDTFSEFVADENGNIKRKIPFKDLPQDVAEKLVGLIDNGEELCIGKELLMDYTKLAEHKYEERVVKEPTCSEEGLIERWCTVCNEVVETKTIPCIPHTPGEWVVSKEPTCTEPGEEQQLCEVCNEVIDTRPVEPLGHQGERREVITEPTCQKEGVMGVYCPVCNQLLRTETMPVVPHEGGPEQVMRQPTCSEDGLIEVRCKYCGLILSTKTIPARGHSYGEWSHTYIGEDGIGNDVFALKYSATKTCSVCGATITETHYDKNYDGICDTCGAYVGLPQERPQP